MASPDTVPVMRKEQLPEVGNLFYKVADGMAGKRVKRNLAVTAIDTGGHSGLIRAVYEPPADQLNFLQIISGIANIPTLVRQEQRMTRANVGAVAHLGGFAVVQMCERAMDKLTPEFFALVHTRLVSVQTKLETAHRTSIHYNGADRKISKHLVDARHILRPELAVNLAPTAPTE